MNALNLQLINEQSPYEVWQTAEGDFNFETDYGVLYRISFRIEQTIWEDGAYEFSIINIHLFNYDKKVFTSGMCQTFPLSHFGHLAFLSSFLVVLFTLFILL